MKTALIYFTGTGNSLAAARILASKLSETAIMSVKEMLDKSLFRLDVDVCGFVFPVYCQNAPEIVQRLVRLLQVPAEAYLFGVATHNGDVGYAHFTLDRILRKKGRSLNAGYAVLMPGNSIAPRDSTNSEAEIARRIKESASALSMIAEAVVRKETVPYTGSASLRKRLKGIRNMFRHKVVYRVPQSFWATEACNKCGICERICPEHNIRIGSALPEWGGRCQMCHACIHWCPKSAVQNGKDTMNRKRYHHPDISLADMLSGHEVSGIAS